MNIKTFGKDSFRQVAIVVEAKVCKNLTTPEYSTMKFLALDRHVSDTTSYKLTEEQKETMKSHDLLLADPEADWDGKLPVDILIGAEYYHALQSREELCLPGGLVLTQSIDKKYILGGTSEVECSNKGCKLDPEASKLTAPSYCISAEPIGFSILNPHEEQVTLDQFNSLDALGIKNIKHEKSPISEKFDKTTELIDGRYVVELPLKEAFYKKLVTNFPMAFTRFRSWVIKHKRKKDSTEYDKFVKIMKEQLNLGIIEEVKPLGTMAEVQRELAANPQVYDGLAVTPGSQFVHYLPWHGVYKPQTGKLRVVYDAASKPNKGAFSLNSCLETGPDMMNSLYQILLQFRCHRYACKADIEKAFLQVEIAAQYRDALRLLWMKDGVVWVLRFARLPFGLTCSPYLLAAVLQKHLTGSEIDKELVDQILAAFYVDDNVWSVKTFKDLMDRHEVTLREFLKAGMKLREWNSNSKEAREHFRTLGDSPPDIESVLGMKWDVRTDKISINADRIRNLIGKQPKTKRKFWSFIAQVFDPLGLLAPYTVMSKLLQREVSKACKGWESKLPIELAERVCRWMEDFTLVPALVFPRHVGIVDAKSEELVCFCDASSQAYGVGVYLVSRDEEGKSTVNLLTGKSRIAPCPAQTIPRLELTAAVLGVNIMSHVRKAFSEIPKDKVYFLSDSRNVIFWIHNGSRSVPPYVANRLDTIFEYTEASQWLHVATDENAADLPSRGCFLSELVNSDLWKEGPGFLKKGITHGKSTVDGYKLAETGLKEKIPDGCLQEMEVFQTNVEDSNMSSLVAKDAEKVCSIIDINKCGTYDKLIRTTVHVLLFIKKLAGRAKRSLPGISKYIELDGYIRRQVEVAWIQAIQRKHYPDLFKLAANPETRVSRAMKGFFKDHGVFLDKELNVLRVTTRLQESLKPKDTVYPILLPPKDRFTILYIRKIHEDNGHAGIPQTLSYLRLGVWVPQGRSIVKYVLRRCNPCRKVSGPFYTMPKHPPLPGFRVQRSRCFKNIGVDFVGPIDITDEKYEVWRIKSEMEKKRQRVTRSRSQKKNKAPPRPKAYVLIITCAVTRMVHLEATLGMTVNDFTMGFHRFMNAHGVPEIINSDNAKTFIRSHKEFNAIYKSSRVRKLFDQKRIMWHFYTDRSPWMGGFIERNNSIFKSVCRKVYGKALLSFDEFRTMISDAMGVVNDRPLTYVYSDLNSAGTEITPSMLCYGHRLREPPALSWRKPKDEDEMTLGQRYIHLEKVKDSFWKAWSEEYLTMLMERHIKQGRVPIKQRVPKINDVVLVRNENMPRRTWRLGKILAVKKGTRDEVIREVQLLTTNTAGKRSLLKRSPSFLVPLEVGTEYLKTENTLLRLNEDLEGSSKQREKDKLKELAHSARFEEEDEIQVSSNPLEVVLQRSSRLGRRTLVKFMA